MVLPFQCLVARSGPTATSHEWTLFGASSSKLVVQSSNGDRSIWPEQDDRVRQEDETQEPPGKRIKLSVSKDTEKKPNFLSLVLSNDGQYLVGVTGEDKCIRVFQIDSQNRLQQLSERCMLRRPCSITLSSDDSTILCADKFGDVYALPLLPSPDEERPETPVIQEPVETKEDTFAPAATVLTVHSGRNRKTLEEQLKQKAKGPAKPREIIKFKHDLLLGHVSMLTDIVFAKTDSRTYIITADRDEHIRISRGPPQAHIIEGFCFGHEAFVNRLCLTQSGSLVSGGGDDHLFVWDWKNYQLIEKLPIRDVVLDHINSRAELGSAAADKDNFKIAVTGIWNVPSSSSKNDEILVACEGIPALFHFNIGSAATTDTAIPLNGNALDVAFVQTSQKSCTVFVAIDHVHKPGSTVLVRDDQNAPRLQCFSNTDGRWQEDVTTEEAVGWFGSQGQEDSRAGPELIDEKALRDMLYNVENLRKRPGAED
ncbi:hypothetical protein P153DRAFT_373589 [Dothidotthia symphoricarpi CBS 119687]|uniref:Uncharacterized protein n=1 Tax=Dothidotthia symphoricarpi CBS 119687 TaxID=1392245 RepID=A0A6A6ALT0_9PLEO|nr:uncharacterized protein P153DRAFT_373589 [Dothidotthia symphoricarpi CBS 119687]KAF2132942.1 hypothetical protein P153DRAFT_373589 [Dothidotthia symphoricarpi CBS 119687]